MSATVFSDSMIEALVAAAAAHPRRRLHRNVHRSYDDPCQRLFNAIGVDSYIRPHRHSLDPRDECLVAVRGAMALLVFDDCGAIRQAARFGVPAANMTERLNAGVEVPAGVWHTVVALAPGSVLFEVKAGPFDPAQAKEFAPWAPEEGSAAAQGYLAQLKRAVGSSW
ncbi:MAG: WbuC family cupin fold metalloprotein [Proteobacteria bacterium]|nr:WbuC family cupin fold metalloprotein [Pseudomonadota bacterium]